MLIDSIIAGLLAVMIVFVVLGILTVSVAFLSKICRKMNMTIPLDQEKEMVALFAALHSAFRNLQSTGVEYELLVEGNVKKLQVKEWDKNKGQGVIQLNEKQLEVSVEEGDFNA